MSTWARASLPGSGVDLDVLSASLSFDESWTPYVQGTIVAGVTDASILAYLDPRARVRCTGVISDGVTDRAFDLLMRGRDLDYSAMQLTLTLDCDEALLLESRLVQAGAWTPTSGSVRGIVAHVLASIGATLEDGIDDATVDPAASIWLPGASGQEYLQPILTAAGLRLYCDELRSWRLVDADTALAGGTILSPTVNIEAATDSFNLDSDDEYFDTVIIKYSYTDAAGNPNTKYDYAGQPSGFYDISAAGSAPYNVSLGLSQNDNMQFAQQLPQTGEWYVAQNTVGSNGTRTPYETCVINRLRANGQFLDSMTLTDAGHGTSLGLEYTSSGVYVWMSWADPGTKGGKAEDLLRFRYVSSTVERDTLAGATVMPKFTSLRALASMDFGTDRICLRTVSGGISTYTLRSINDLKAGRDIVKGRISVDDSPPTLQGFATTQQALFLYYGAPGNPSSDPMILREYAWNDGRLLDQVSTAGLGLQANGTYVNGRGEPESSTIYRDPNTQQLYLDLGMVLGYWSGGGALEWRMYRAPLPDALNAQPTRVLSLEYEMAPPAAGAAKRILTRRMAHASSVSVRARSDTSIAPTMAALVTLPDGRPLAGAIARVEFSWPDNVMHLTTRDLVAPSTYSWLAARLGVSWDDITPGTDWSEITPATAGLSPNAWIAKFAPGVDWNSAAVAGVSWQRLGQAPLQTWSAAPTGKTWAQLPAGEHWNDL